MGIAVIIPTISFADNNLGTVTLATQVALQSLSINGSSSVSGTTDAAEFTVSYTPIETTQRGVVWSVESGDTYASIDADTGVLTVLAAATSASSVTIRATSSVNPSIYVDKTITVFYHIALEDRTNYIQFTSQAQGRYVTDIIIPNDGKVVASFKPSQLYTMTVFGVQNGNTSMGIDLSMQKVNNVFKMVGRMCGAYFNTADTPVANTRYLATLSASDLVFSPSLGTNTEDTYTSTDGLPIAICSLRYNGTGTTTTGQFIGYFYGLEVYDGDNVLVHCLIPQADKSLLDLITGTSYTLTGSGTYGTD